ncbi:hypothetical protein SLEP1_g58090 [Rubroshorea leprosula]|uniref:Uncharacterized protein n=1 Tax=Rubroshorea leprosula TaxID=152421 RepID=A0AAV5MSQ8_9ROSI|nr:hypothetical protein SLEP1_g58090 [Rubroshorea leprosula]
MQRNSNSILTQSVSPHHKQLLGLHHQYQMVPSIIRPLCALLHGMHLGFGIGPSFAAHHPLIFNQAVAPMQSPQAYFHPNGRQYGQQQMFLRQSRQVVYMPSSQPEMPYKGRDF